MKKPKKLEADDIFSHIRQPAPLPDPIKAETFLSEDSQRMTRAFYGTSVENGCVESADKCMSEARDHPEILVGVLYWHFILPWLENSTAELAAFWGSFNCEPSEIARRKAFGGPRVVNRAKEQLLIGVVHEYKALSLKQWGFALSKQERPSILANIAKSDADVEKLKRDLKEKMVDWVLEAIWNDPEAPKRLHELLKNKSAVKSEYSDQPTVNGRIFNAFVLELTEHWCLPTKKAVRNTAGFGNEDEDETAAARAFGKLGLGGLPEA